MPTINEQVQLVESLSEELEKELLALDEMDRKSIDPPESPPTPDEQEAENPSKEEPIMSGPALIKSDKTRAFSISKLIQGVVDPTFKDWGFEREISQETAHRSGKDSSAIMVPWGALTMKAAQDSITAPSGTPPTDLGQSLARPANAEELFTITSDALFKPTIGAQLGVRQHVPPAGAFYVPRLVNNVDLVWVARDADVPSTDARFDSIPCTPHTLGGTVQVNRSALIDCRPLMDVLMLEQLQAAAVSGLDDALIGTNPVTTNAPEGLMIQSVDGGAVSDLETLLALMRAAEMQIGKAPALAFGPMFRDFLAISAAGDALLAASASTVLNERVSPVVSVKLDAPVVAPTASTIFTGDFSVVHQVVFGAGIELAVNPYASTVYAKGAVLLRVLVDADTLVTDAEAVYRGIYTPTP